MSLNKNKLLIALSALILLVASTTIIFPGIVDNIITGFANIGGFQVSLNIMPIFAIDNATEINPVVVNGTNITISMPVNYYDDVTENITYRMPEGFECGTDWYINESGNIKSVSINGVELTWEAEKAVKDTSAYFTVTPPTIISDITYTGDSYYEKTIIINSCCPLKNVSANVSVNNNYQDYTLYLIENSTLINKSTEYNLQVYNGIASFYGFNLSNKTFRLLAAPNSSLVEEVVHRGGGGGRVELTLSLLNHTPNQTFLVEPNSVNILLSTPGQFIFEMTIYNLGEQEKEFIIVFTKNFIKNLQNRVTLPGEASTNLLVSIDTTPLEAGTYTDEIYIKSGEEQEKVVINLELLQSSEPTPEPEPEAKPPAEQRPQIIRQIEQVKTQLKKPNVLAIVIISLVGLLLMSMVVFFHLRGRVKTIRVKE